MTPKNQWTLADRISDQIIDILNAERKASDFDPVQALAGQFLALAGFIRTAPGAGRPDSLRLLESAIELVLVETLAGSETPNEILRAAAQQKKEGSNA